MIFLGADRSVDSRADFASASAHFEKLISHKIEVPRLAIAALSEGWDTPLAPGRFRSGCAPLMALREARHWLDNGAEAVLIEVDDPIKSKFAHLKSERQALLAIFGPGYPLPEAYTTLSREFLSQNGISVDLFRDFACRAFENYQRSARKRGLAADPPESRFQLVTSLFRAVDCANPSVDFRGKILLGSARAAQVLAPTAFQVRVAGVAIAPEIADHPENIGDLARFDGMLAAFEAAVGDAGLDFRTEYLEDRALLEVYTCFPVVPLAFLLKCGFAKDMSGVMELLKQREITVTGGMNLARAAWNAPVLNALITMEARLRSGPRRWGGVHGNGGLGGKQGFAVLERFG